MKIDIADINSIIKKNNLPKVTNSISLNPDRSPTSDGLFSYELFGKPGSYDRKTIFGYIDLKKNYFHPTIYRLLISLQRNLIDCIDGSENFIIDKNGYLIKDPNGNTGIRFLYNNWEKIKFKKSVNNIEENDLRKEKLGLLSKLSKDEIFVNKWLVIPPFYRDINWAKVKEGKIIKDAINDLYIKLINLTNDLDSSDILDFYAIIKDKLIQNTLNEIYDYLSKYLYKKDGMIKKNLLGKSIDFTCRSVISANRYNFKTYKDVPVNFEYTGVPLAELCSLFYPFLIYEITNYLETFFETVQEIPQVIIAPSNKESIPIKIHKNAYIDFLPDKLKKTIDKFIKDPESRTEPIKIKGIDDKYYNIPYLRQYFPERPLTWMDFIYFLMDKIVADKHIIFSRYPIDTFQNIFISKIFILTTVDTERRIVGEKQFEYYPDLSKPKIEYIDTVRISNVYLKRLGADFDGDTVSLRSLYTKEANLEAEEIMTKKSNLLSGIGSNILNLDKEAGLALYYLTKD